MNKNDTIYIAGHRGLAGSAIVRNLKENGYNNLIFKNSSELDLINIKCTENFFIENKPDYVFMCAGRVGGIKANISYPVEFAYNNSLMALSVLQAAYKSRVKKLVYLGSSCIYPKDCKQPMVEEYLLTGSLEPTNEGYALAKLLGVRLCSYYRQQYGCDFIAAIPPNLYGQNDNYDYESSHVIAALIRRFYEAKKNKLESVIVWGSGNAFREFMHTDDYAQGVIFAMNNYSNVQHINIGSGSDIMIKDLAYLIADVVGFSGEIFFDSSKPDGMARKLMSSDKIFSLGFQPNILLKEGLKNSYNDFLTKFEN